MQESCIPKLSQQAEEGPCQMEDHGCFSVSGIQSLCGRNPGSGEGSKNKCAHDSAYLPFNSLA